MKTTMYIDNDPKGGGIQKIFKIIKFSNKKAESGLIFTIVVSYL